MSIYSLRPRSGRYYSFLVSFVTPLSSVHYNLSPTTMALRRSTRPATTMTSSSSSSGATSLTITSRKRKSTDKTNCATEIPTATVSSTVITTSTGTTTTTVTKRKSGVNVSSLSSTTSTSPSATLPNTLPLTYENRVWSTDPLALVCGVDEAGRGPLAGPVVASACIVFPPCLWSLLVQGSSSSSSSLPVWPSSLVTADTFIPARAPVAGVNDSKALEEEDREQVYPLLMEHPALVFGISIIDHAVIDRINILQATYLAMSRATARARIEANRRLEELSRTLPQSNKLSPEHQQRIQEWLTMMMTTMKENTVETTITTTTNTTTTTNNGTKKKGKGTTSTTTITSSSTSSTTTYPINLHTVFIDGPKVPFRIEAATVLPTAEQKGPDHQTDTDENGKEYTVLPPDYGVQEVELKNVDIDGGFSAVLNNKPTNFSVTLSIDKNSTNSSNGPSVLTDLYTQKLQSLLGYIYTVQPVIGGDSKVYSIAAASIVAKVTRDRLMKKAEELWPGYGLGDHKGYGTASHMQAIHKLGACPIHRLTFAPLKNMYPDLAEKARGAPLDQAKTNNAKKRKL